ncbi:MAG: hypothetical protein HRT72_07295, partial [Flavobacteriales bacterium]|nr:hypothetical protein [Flavobacteriales bacterium]
ASFQVGKLDESIFYSALAINSEIGDSVRLEMVYLKAKCLLLKDEDLKAGMLLLSLDTSQIAYFKDKRLFYEAILAYRKGEFMGSEELFKKLVLKTDYQNLESLSRDAYKANKYKKKFIPYLNYVFPGLAQTYLGDPLDGLNSLVLVGSVWFLYAHAFSIYGPLDAILSVYPWLQRYYQGSIKNASKMGPRKTERIQAEVLDEILSIVESSKQSIIRN